MSNLQIAETIILSLSVWCFLESVKAAVGRVGAFIAASLMIVLGCLYIYTIVFPPHNLDTFMRMVLR